MRSICRYCAFVALLTFTPVAVSASETCELEFDLRAGSAIGSIATGDALSGEIKFDVIRNWQQGAETRSYFVKGSITVTGDDVGQVAAAIDVVHVVRAPHTWDYVSIVASDVDGDLGGETRYFDPMVFTLADAPGSLGSFDLPRVTSDWNLLARTQKFQFHTPDGNQIFFGTVSNLTGACSH